MKAFPTLSSPVACALLIVMWAAIYLPGLGAVEIKGEEIRRIMPGVTMIETGNWIVPVMNGKPYLRKPPLVNWAIATSIKTFGARNEWTVRAPSVVAVLAMGLVMFFACAPWLGVNTALAAVLIVYTTVGIVDKGRIAEIEAIYIALTGMAFSCWLAWTATGRSRWLIWPVTGLFLGVGLLAKGPTNLAFFYAIVGFIAWKSWRKKGSGVDAHLASWAHLCGILIMIGVFALWCMPYMRQASTMGAGGVWARQMSQRLGAGDKGTVFYNFVRSLVNYLPWTIGLPLFWRRATLSRLGDGDRLMVEAARWPIVVCAFGLMFIPGMLPRYTLLMVIPYALLLALLLRGEMAEASLRWPLAAASIAGVGMLVFGALVAPRLSKHGAARDFAAQINSFMPAGSTIYIFDPSVEPVIFYIHGQFTYPDSVKTLPDDVPWLLAPQNVVKRLREKFRESQVHAEARDASGKPYVLLSLQGRLK